MVLGEDCDAVARYQSSVTHENGLEYVLCLTQPPPDKPTSRSEFADEMVTDLLTKDVTTQPSCGWDAVLGALKVALKSRDAYVTRVLWEKIDTECGTTDWHHIPIDGQISLDVSDVEITPELLRFLLCYAQVPGFALALNVQNGLTTSNVLDATRADRSADEEREIAALMATVMHALFIAREWRNGKRACREVDPAWDNVLAVLIKAMPKNPRLVVRRVVPEQYPSFKVVKRVVDVAVQCAKASTSNLVALLKHCSSARPTHLADAFVLALKCGVLNDDVLITALSAIYKKILLYPNPFMTKASRVNSARHPLSGCLTSAWAAVASAATKNKLVPLCGSDKTRVALVPVPNVECGTDDLRDPSLFVDIVHALDEQHGPYNNWKSDVAHLACDALDVAMRDHGKVMLVQALVDLVIGHQNVLYLLDNVPGFLCRAVVDFQTVFDSLEPVEFSLVMQTAKDDPLAGALTEVIQRGHRDAARTLMEHLVGFPEPKLDLLLSYVRNMCTVKWPCPGSDVDHAFSSDVKAAHCAEVKGDFEDFLRRGSPWTDEELQAALRVASRERASIAVQVLVSPPHETIMKENDHFVAHILQHVLAPEGHVANQAKARFEEAAL